MIEPRYDSVLVFFSSPQIVTKNSFHAWKDRELARDRYESSTTEVWDGNEKDMRWDDDDDDDDDDCDDDDDNYVDETENENEK